jgi:hypothetical protein
MAFDSELLNLSNELQPGNPYATRARMKTTFVIAGLLQFVLTPILSGQNPTLLWEHPVSALEFDAEATEKISVEGMWTDGAGGVLFLFNAFKIDPDRPGGFTLPTGSGLVLLGPDGERRWIRYFNSEDRTGGVVARNLLFAWGA